MGDVIPLDIKPKSMRRTYKRHHFTVTFIPATKKWQWSVELVVKTKYTDTADNMQKAIRAAERCIDKVVAVQERTGT